MYTGNMYFVNCRIRDLRNAASAWPWSLYVLILFCSSIRWFWACLPRLDTLFWYLGNFNRNSLLQFINTANSFLFSAMLFLLCSIASRSRSILSLASLASVSKVSLLIFGERSFSHLSKTCRLFAFSLRSFTCFSANLKSMVYKTIFSTNNFS